LFFVFLLLFLCGRPPQKGSVVSSQIRMKHGCSVLDMRRLMESIFDFMSKFKASFHAAKFYAATWWVKMKRNWNTVFCRLLQATGVELNPWLVIYSRLRALKLRGAGFCASAEFVVGDLWKHDLGRYNHVVIFGVDSMMSTLHSKLAREMTADCSVIACRFPLPCKPSRTIGEGLDTVWLYKRSDVMRYSTPAKHRDDSRIESW